MIRNFFALALLLASFALAAPAQDCKLKFSVVFSDSKDLQIGLTADQKKMWDKDGAKKFKGMCLDDKNPDYIILWNQGMSGAEISKAAVDHVNVVLATGETATTTTAQASVTSAYKYVRPSSQVRGRADYFILDTSKKPYAMIRQGQGFQDVPRDTKSGVDKSLNTSDLASTIPDPVEALANALKWLKKEKKI